MELKLAVMIAGGSQRHGFQLERLKMLQQARQYIQNYRWFMQLHRTAVMQQQDVSRSQAA